MSSLGIRFATPYKGANGILVNGSTIKIDPKSTIEFYDGFNYGESNLKSKIDFNSIRIEQATNGNTENLTEIVGGNIIIQDTINNIINNTTAQQIELYSELVQANNIISNEGSEVTVYTPDGAAIIQKNQFDKVGVAISNLDTGEYTGINSKNIANTPYNINKTDGVQFPTTSIVDIHEKTAGAVIPDLNNYILININDTNYKLIIAQ